MSGGFVIYIISILLFGILLALLDGLRLHRMNAILLAKIYEEIHAGPAGSSLLDDDLTESKRLAESLYLRLRKIQEIEEKSLAGIEEIVEWTKLSSEEKERIEELRRIGKKLKGNQLTANLRVFLKFKLSELSLMNKIVYCLPGHGGKLGTGLCEGRLQRGWQVAGRANWGTVAQCFTFQTDLLSCSYFMALLS